MKLLFIFLCLTISAVAQTANYRVKFHDINTPKINVTATLPFDGAALRMEQSWPGDVPEVADRGWPALVRNLKATDARGRELEFVLKGPGGWELKAPYKGIVHLSYEVDYFGPSTANWPAPRETAFRDEDHFMMVGRSLFITSAASKANTVNFNLPRGWKAVVPWRVNGANFLAGGSADLTENLVVFSRAPVETVTAGGFRVSVTAMGNWQAVRGDVVNVLRGVIPRYLQMTGAAPRNENYSVVLLPILDHGGEAYRASFAYTFEKSPSRADRNVWGHTLAHEIFHYWNGWRLRGADYASSQWFQEGFTDYTADLAMSGAGLITPDEFLARMGSQLVRYRDLKTPLGKPGTHKGPSLYGGGALAAFCWDIRIRRDTSGKYNISDVFKTLWRNTDQGKNAYEWNDIFAVLKTIDPAYDWQSFYDRYIQQQEKLPLDETVRLAGLNIVKSVDGAESIEFDPTAGAKAKTLFAALVKGN
jgi:predicted metalloprotease with PDZ domain